MESVPPTQTPAEQQSQRVALAEIDYYVANLKHLLGSWVLAFLMVSWLFRAAVPIFFMACWMSSYFVVSVVRFVAFKVYAKEEEESRLRDVRRWRRTLELLSVLHGLLWGVFAWVSFPYISLFMQYMITSILMVSGALAAISITTGAVSLRLYLAVTLGPAIVAWAEVNTSDSWWMAFMLGVLMLIYDGVGRRHGHDVHERLTYANELAQANKLLEESNFSKTRLIVEASHDLRQPVHALGMMLDRINVEGPRREIARRLQEVQTCVDTVSDMLIDLLDLSRLESGEYVVDLQPVNVGSLLRELDQAYGPVAQRKGLNWIVSRSSGWVRSDPAMLKRVMNNLISNAIKYTVSGSVGISCRYEHGVIQLRVSDTGSGIPSDKIDMIFREYVRLNDASQEPGYGIGLAVVKRMLDLLGHSLSVKSRIGHGTRFIVQLHPVDGPELKIVELSPAAAAPQPWRDKLIVFIENDEQLRASTAEVLTSLGAQVVAASSVFDALTEQVLFERRPDLVISDMHLGGVPDGLGVIEVMRREYPAFSLPAILLTGDLTPELQAQTRAMEVRIAYKPVRPSRLKELVANALVEQHNNEPM